MVLIFIRWKVTDEEPPATRQVPGAKSTMIQVQPLKRSEMQVCLTSLNSLRFMLKWSSAFVRSRSRDRRGYTRSVWLNDAVLGCSDWLFGRYSPRPMPQPVQGGPTRCVGPTNRVFFQLKCYRLRRSRPAFRPILQISRPRLGHHQPMHRNPSPRRRQNSDYPNWPPVSHHP